MKECGSKRPWSIGVISSKRNREAPFPENKPMIRQTAELNVEVIHEDMKSVFLKSSQIQRRNSEGTATCYRSHIQTVQYPAGGPEQTERGTTGGKFLRKDYFNPRNEDK